jgi:eukaryotic-like serine/threonine-protein kinase
VPSDPLLWRFLNQAGELAYAHADYDRARSSYEQSLALIVATVGHDHLWIADTHGNLGEVAAAQHRIEDARDHFELALEIRRRTLGDDSYWVKHTLAHLGDVQLCAGELDRARQTYASLLTEPTTDDPAGCDREIWARNGLALVALLEGDPEEALRIASFTREASPKDEPSHLDLCDRLDLYALALLALGRTEEAWAHLGEVEPKLESSAGSDHRVMVPLLVAQAQALHALGRDDESRSRLSRAMAIHARDGANVP